MIKTGIHNENVLFNHVCSEAQQHSYHKKKLASGKYHNMFLVVFDLEHNEPLVIIISLFESLEKMNISKITTNKKQYIDLLLLADEQENMIDRYLNKGTMYVLEDNGVKAICVVTDEKNGVLEIKNLAVEPASQRQGYGKQLIQFLQNKYRGSFRILQVGTGDSLLTIPFYESCGFKKTHYIKNFFVDNYDHPIYESGKQLIDMVYLQLEI